MESSEQAIVSQYSNSQLDRASILEHLDPANDIVRIMNGLLGLKIEHVRSGGKIQIRYKRVNKPEFTDEYIRSLCNDLQLFLNYTIQVSRFEQDKIKWKVGQYLMSLKIDLATHGDDNYISDNTWQKIIDIHSEKVIEKNEEKSGWNKFGIKWEYNRPVNYDMVKLCKDFDEEVDQAIKFRKIINTFGSLVEASFNKSYSDNHQALGMMLLALGEIRTESITQREVPKEKKGLSGLFSRTEQEKEKSWG